MTFYNKMPSEAKNRKRFIFGEKYEEIFNDNVNVDKVLLAYRLFEKIEEEKNLAKANILSVAENFENEFFILYASYYILQQIEGLLSTVTTVSKPVA
jgi:hypothetical protein